jgi:mannose-6-phosphate isomerase-like protein (cupin superfamily)
VSTPSGSDAGGALARCVGDPCVFETEHWGRSPLLRRAAADDVFADVFTAEDLDEFLGSGIRRPVIRLVRDGAPVPGERYTGRVRLGGSDFRDVVVPERVAALFGGGATIVAQSLHRTHPKVRAFAERLSDEISHPLQANAYLTPPGATGLAPHSDGHDVIVLQLQGSKHWAVDGVGDLDLRPGDTLYVPAGHEHAATSNDRTSLHLTLGIVRVTYRSVLERVLRRGPAVLDDPLPLRHRDRDGSIRAGIDDMLTLVRRHLETVDAAEIERAERRRTAVRPPRPGALTAAIDLMNLRHRDLLAPVGTPWSTTRSSSAPDSTIRIETDGRWLEAPAACATALAQLDRVHVVKISELDGLDDASQLILARRLTTAGFCRVVDASTE